MLDDQPLLFPNLKLLCILADSKKSRAQICVAAANMTQQDAGERTEEASDDGHPKPAHTDIAGYCRGIAVVQSLVHARICLR